MIEENIYEFENCTLCNEQTNKLSRIAEEWLIEEIKKDHPEWTGKDGICRKCIDYYYNLLDEVQVII